MVSFRLGEKRSIGAAGNAASGHKMFIAAGSDFSGGKVMVRRMNAQKHEPPPEWAAVRVGAMPMKMWLVLNLQANDKQLNGNGYKRTGNYKTNNCQDATPIFECGR